MGEEPPVTGQGVWEEDLGSAGMLWLRLFSLPSLTQLFTSDEK